MPELDVVPIKENSSKKQKLKVKANLKSATQLLKLLDDVFDTYIKNQLKELEIIPYMASKKFDISEIANKNFETAEKRRIKRKLIILQQIYIEGMEKEKYDEDYMINKTFANDKNSLVQDLAILLFGVDGLNYRILEKNGLEIEKDELEIKKDESVIEKDGLEK